MDALTRTAQILCTQYPGLALSDGRQTARYVIIPELRDRFLPVTVANVTKVISDLERIAN